MLSFNVRLSGKLSLKLVGVYAPNDALEYNAFASCLNSAENCQSLDIERHLQSGTNANRDSGSRLLSKTLRDNHLSSAIRDRFPNTFLPTFILTRVFQVYRSLTTRQ